MDSTTEVPATIAELKAATEELFRAYLKVPDGKSDDYVRGLADHQPLLLRVSRALLRATDERVALDAMFREVGELVDWGGGRTLVESAKLKADEAAKMKAKLHERAEEIGLLRKGADGLDRAVRTLTAENLELRRIGHTEASTELARRVIHCMAHVTGPRLREAVLYVVEPLLSKREREITDEVAPGFPPQMDPLPPLRRGDRVIALKNVDPAGANAEKGEWGTVFEEANAYGDNAGPMVRWDSGCACNVYAGDVRKATVAPKCADACHPEQPPASPPAGS